VLSYTIIQLLIEQNVYPIIAMAGVLISVFGVMFLMKRTATEGLVPQTDSANKLKLVKKG